MKDEQLERSLDMAESQAKLALGFLDQAIKRIEWLRKTNQINADELTALTEYEKANHIQLVKAFVTGESETEVESGLMKTWERNTRSNPDYWDFVKKKKQLCDKQCPHPEEYRVGDGCADCWKFDVHNKREQ